MSTLVALWATLDGTAEDGLVFVAGEVEGEEPRVLSVVTYTGRAVYLAPPTGKPTVNELAGDDLTFLERELLAEAEDLQAAQMEAHARGWRRRERCFEGRLPFVPPEVVR